MIKQTAIDFNMSETKLVVEGNRFFKNNKKTS